MYVVDISGSMQGKLLVATKSILSAALSKLDQEDSFNIIAFNGETYVFSKSMESATKEAVEKAVDWMSTNFIAEGGTDILVPLNQVFSLDHLRAANFIFAFIVIFL